MNYLIGKIAYSNNRKTYIVRGWYLDSNGCLKTYGEKYNESFVDLTKYE